MAPPAGASEPKGTFLGTIATVTNNVIGAGLLSLPYTFKRASLIPGASAMAVTGVLNCCSMLLLAKCAQLTGATSYRDLSELAFGPAAARVLAAIMALYTLGSCISYIILLGDALPELLSNAHATGAAAAWVGRDAVIPIAAAAVLLPLSLQRNLSALRYTSIASFVCILYTAGMIIARAAIGPTAPVAASASSGAPGDVVLARGGAGLFIGLPITMVAFTMHYNAPRFYAELLPSLRTMRTFTAIGVAVFTFTAAVYEGTAAGGYMLFGGNTKGDILENFADDDVPAFIARVALVMVMLFSYPLAFNSYRASVTALLPASWQAAVNAGPARTAAAATAASKEGSHSRNVVSAACAWLRYDWPFALLTLALVTATVALAIALPSLEVVLGYKGALGGSLIVYVFPGLMYASISRQLRAGKRFPAVGGGGGSAAGGGGGGGGEAEDEGVATPLMTGHTISPASVISAGSSNTPLLWGTSSGGGAASSSSRGEEEEEDGGHSHSHSGSASSSKASSSNSASISVLTTPDKRGHSRHSSQDADGNAAAAAAASWGDIWRDLWSSGSGRLGLAATAYGCTILVLGTATTAGVLS